MRSATSSDRPRGFTLVELLVVIGIITVLIALLLPVLNKARAQAQQVVCASNMRQIAVACLAYAAENKNILPIPYDGQSDGLGNPILPCQAIYLAREGIADWNHGTLIPYIPGGYDVRQRLFSCPAMGGSPHVRVGGNTGGGGTSWMVNFDYTFNQQLAAWYGDPHNRRYGVQITRVHHAENKIALMELIVTGDIEDSPVMLGGDANNNAIVIPLMATRHAGMANASFLDGHVELMNPQWFNGATTSTVVTYENDAWRHYIQFSSDQ